MQADLRTRRAATKFSLEGELPEAEDHPDDVPLVRVIAHPRETIKETKRIAAALRPTALDDLALKRINRGPGRCDDPPSS